MTAVLWFWTIWNICQLLVPMVSLFCMGNTPDWFRMSKPMFNIRERTMICLWPDADSVIHNRDIGIIPGAHWAGDTLPFCLYQHACKTRRVKQIWSLDITTLLFTCVKCRRTSKQAEKGHVYCCCISNVATLCFHVVGSQEIKIQERGETFINRKSFGLAEREHTVPSLANSLALSCCVGEMQSGLQCVTLTAVGRDIHSCLSKLGHWL